MNRLLAKTVAAILADCCPRRPRFRLLTVRFSFQAKSRRRSLTLTCIFAAIAFFLMFIVWKAS